jgi:hypothetical protein
MVHLHTVVVQPTTTKKKETLESYFTVNYLFSKFFRVSLYSYSTKEREQQHSCEFEIYEFSGEARTSSHSVRSFLSFQKENKQENDEKKYCNLL